MKIIINFQLIKILKIYCFIFIYKKIIKKLFNNLYIYYLLLNSKLRLYYNFFFKNY